MSAGETNSSITRVWPVFQALLSRDASGRTWIPPLLNLAGNSLAVRDRLVTTLVPLKSSVKEAQRYKHEAIQKYRPDGVDLARCFEASLPPPAAFLRWLVANPSKLRWNGNALDDTSETGSKRRALSGQAGVPAQQEIMQEARDAIETYGAMGSRRKWWAFEGFTSVDCLLESDDAVLFAEGKRNDVLSEATDWYHDRNQVIRNLEVAEVVAAGRPFGVLLISERGMIHSRLKHSRSDCHICRRPSARD